MNFVSTRNTNLTTSFHTALFNGLAPDGGLYIPSQLTPLITTQASSLSALGHTIMTHFIDDVPDTDLQIIINNALNFTIPLVPLEDNLYLLEVFHGPTLAFKDVGARFMANMLAYFLARQKRKLAILVATSGDTGSAIANAFHHMPNINVYILYPSNKVSFLQEQQMTTLGDNIHALEVDGTFDDCQRLVKHALQDKSFKEQHTLTTANSINIARLLPQIIYHSFGLCQLKQLGITKPPILSVPSGNFGNLTAAIYAQALGFSVQSFIAATNQNAIVPDYLATGHFSPKPSQHTLSNAMDVGHPSNFERLTSYFANNLQKMRAAITGITISDPDTLNEIRRTYDRTGYILDPHTAVGVAAARQIKTATPMIITATAHPAKFPEVIKQAINREAVLPERLQKALDGKKQVLKIKPEFEMLKFVIKSMD